MGIRPSQTVPTTFPNTTRDMNEKIKDLAINGLLTDGAHHKQWYLEEILKAGGVDLKELKAELATPGAGGDWYEWEPGISP